MKFTFDIINRRTHLYFGLFFMPLFFVYGFSSLLISHHAWFRSGNPPEWTVLFDKEYSHPIKEDYRESAEEILEEHNLAKSFFSPRPNNGKLVINQNGFWKSVRLTYFMEENRLLAEQQYVNFDQSFLRIHFKAGYQQNRILDDLWAVLVDLVCISILFWIGSGIYMWWKIRKIRLWGSLALSGGIVSFIILLITL